MTTFTIDTDNNITAYAHHKHAATEMHIKGMFGGFVSESDLAEITNDWAISQFTDVWNGFAGAVPFDDLKPVKKFTDRKTAVARIWKAIQRLEPVVAPTLGPDAPKTTRSSKRAKAAADAPTAPTARENTKATTVLELVRRKGGATLQELMLATGWQAHSVRGFISILCKKGVVTITSTRRAEDKARVYQA